MLIGLGIRDLVLVETLDLALGPGLTVLTGETGAGKSVILGALALALGGRGEAALVRRGAPQAAATALFAPPPGHPVWLLLQDKGLATGDEELVLRRTLGDDGRSRAFVDDQPVAAGALRELAGLLVEIHGQHQTVGLLDPRTHGPLLDAFGGLGAASEACARAWRAWRAARDRLDALRAEQDRAASEGEELTLRLAELDRLAPRAGEEAALAAERRLLASAAQALADLAAARELLDDERVVGRLSQARRAVERARETVVRAVGGETEGPAAGTASARIAAAAEAVDRALSESLEAAAALDAAAEVFTVEPERLEQAEERLFALRAAARRLGVEVDALPAERGELARRLLALESAAEALSAARSEVEAARASYDRAAADLTAGRGAAAERLTGAVTAELAPLKLDKARFRVAVEALPPDRQGPSGADRVSFEIATLPSAPFASLASVASGGELARLALALKVCLADRGGGFQPLMIFDEVDQGVGGAVADAVGQRLARLATDAQVIVVTHSPQVAARADSHWRVSRERRGEDLVVAVEVLEGGRREEEIARMLAGARITDAARAAARALMHA